MAIGQGALHSWARGIVWNLTFERAPCAVPLDFSLPIETGLNLPTLERRLSGDPDRRLVSYLLGGVRFERRGAPDSPCAALGLAAQGGFASVRKELYRLHERDWYRFFDHLPFWPMYINGQGATARRRATAERPSAGGGARRRATRRACSRSPSTRRRASTISPKGFFAGWVTPTGTWLHAKGLLDPSTHD